MPLILFAAGALILGAAEFRLCPAFPTPAREETTEKTRGRLRLIACVLAVLICLLTAGIFASDFALNTDPIEYPLPDGDVRLYSPYVQQFDAFQKGQPQLDVRPARTLVALENPYDYWQREDAGVYYMWDRALYNGNYYSYFGIAPILTVYYPYYLLTGALPGDGVVMIVLSLLTALCLPLCVFRFASLFSKKAPAALLFVLGPAVFIGSLCMLIARGRTPFYYIASVSGSAFTSLFLLCCLCAYGAGKRWKRLCLWALAGVSYGLIFQSRVNVALCAAFLVLPGLWFFIIGRKREETGKKRVWAVTWELCALGLPVALFLCGSMIFNAMRFSGPLDFGSAYQLTVADTSTYRFRFSDLPYAIYHYVLAMPAESGTWPFLTFSRNGFSDYGHYVYHDSALGAFASPLIWAMLLSPAVIADPRYTGRRRIMTAAALLSIPAVALFDFCLGGIIYRYTCDFTLIAALFSAVVLLSLYERAAESRHVWVRAAVLCALLLFTVFALDAALRVSLINDNGNVMVFDEAVTEKFAKWFPLWSPEAAR